MTDTDTISKAMDLARALNARSSSAPDAGRFHSDRVCPSARHADISARTMRQSRLIGGVTDQRVIDSYALLRTRVLNRLQQGKINTLGITSPSVRDGKSLTAANLAISIVLGESHPVLLVDADLRRPSLAGLFGIRARAGLGDYLGSDQPLDELLLKLPIEGLFMLPGRPGAPVRPESLSAKKARQLVTRLKQQVPGGIVIFDMPPALVGADVAAFAPNVDAMLMVLADGRTDQDAVRQAMQILEGANIIGTVLNYSDEPRGPTDYY